MTTIDFFSTPICNPFRLDPSFLANFVGQQPQWGPLGYITYKRTYARKQSNGKQEEFYQTLRRVVEGCYQLQQQHHANMGLPWDADAAQAEAQNMYHRMWQFKLLPPGRGLWATGIDYIKRIGAAPLLNCAFVSTEDIGKSPEEFSYPFSFLMDMSMLGCGVGFDTRGKGKLSVGFPETSTDVHTIPDSREGWVEALRKTLEAYVGGQPIPVWDYSAIRPEGSPIEGFGGVASGPGPLKRLIEVDIPGVLNCRIGSEITSTNIVDLMNLIGRCVIAGNVRRTAEIALGDDDDQEFLDLKNPVTAGDALTSHRWASNNSIFVTKNTNFRDVASRVSVNGEPGLIYLDNIRRFGRLRDGLMGGDEEAYGVNPCGEQPLWKDECCNLVETFPTRHHSLQDYLQTLRCAYVYAKSITLLPIHWERTRKVMEQNRRIGISQSGVSGQFDADRTRLANWSDLGYRYLKQLDANTSALWLIPTSNRLTTMKPSGTVPLLPGEKPGMHWAISEYYIRRVRIAKSSHLVAPLRRAGYRIEDDVYDSTSFVVEFPVKERDFSRGESEVKVSDQFAAAAFYQYFWSDNAVSCTMKFGKGEAHSLEKLFHDHSGMLKTVSALPHDTHTYAQMPYEQITREDYESRSRVLRAINLEPETLPDQRDVYCDGVSCSL